ncbi:5'-nucleotidase/2',3'-cyclic phosphodiesterase [Paenibacillus terrae HPL-003]|uniref:5'-nucleotidase/2',3'-cyclic phosphodiesterase n=1 Tax=Paenibacillus terrae (strain HPL-003) TaxID=985665 RepID=G7W0L6_PAETH|nr:bifunctional UDP-sugar hydrolase/5'-nucleotidase [Paenibacillus terrae]AET59953.1 5'-nucleotidase/2',3'-cyclic phosphodiesterase [Paenibacillus terrae HPL-003]
MEMTTQQTLTILHTNDIHSHFGSMPSIAAMINERRAASGDGLLVLDMGDHMDRMAPETEGTLGGANVDVINLTGYDAITIGNNEGLTFTPDILEQAYAGIHCPVVCGNIRESATGMKPLWMTDALVLDKSGVKVGLLGVTAPFGEFYQLLGWDALDPFEVLGEQIPSLRKQVDVLVVMSHLGLPSDKKLASQFPEIDVILGGHTHHVLEEPLWIGSTALCGAGKYGTLLGEVTLSRNSIHEPFQVTSGGVVPVDHTLLDEKVASAIVLHRRQAERAMKSMVAVTDRKLEIAYDRESPFGNLLAQSVSHFTGTAISLVNAGQLLGPLPQGDISKGMLHSLCPSPINACVMKLWGRDIRLALEQSLLPEFADKKITGFGFRGKVLGTMCVEGLEIQYDPARAPYDKVTDIRVAGLLLEEDEQYTVGTLDMFTFRAGYEMLANGTELRFMLPEFLRDLIEMELKRPGAMEECFAARWLQVSKQSGED